MQFTQNISKKTALPQYTYTLIKVLVFAILVGYTIWTGIQKEIFKEELLNDLKVVFLNEYPLFVLVILLLPCNWGIEALKWLKLIHSFEKISFWQSFKGILTGVACGIATPHGIGDYAGRILQLSGEGRENLVGAVFLTRITQFSVTVLAGTLGLVYFLSKVWQPDFLLMYLLVFSAFFSVMCTILPFFFHRYILRKLKKIWYFWKYFGVLYTFNRSTVLQILWLSAARYMVFCLQFMLLLYVFNVSEDWLLLFMAVNFAFLAKSVIPTLFELGVREYAIVFFFRELGIYHEDIVPASLVLWMINILLPALLGTVFVFQLKFKIK